MNYRYLFRGRRVDGGGWVVGSLLVAEGRKAFIVNDHDHYENMLNGQWFVRANLKDEAFEVDPTTIGQCVGERDQDGTLIFDGDIIYVKEWDKYFPVECDWNCWYLNATDNCEGIDEMGTLSTFKIAGNIHDNPELLEVTP